MLRLEIQNQTIQAQNNRHEHRPLREGEVYGAKIKTRISSHEAIVTVRGQDVKATFTNTLPSSDRVHVQIEKRTDDGVQARIISEVENQKHLTAERNDGKKSELDRVMQSLGLREGNPSLKRAVANFLDRGVPLTKETAQQLQQYVDKGKDSIQQRLTTVEVVAKKGLEPTRENLHAVHEALHGKKLEEQIREISSKNSSFDKVSTNDRVEATTNEYSKSESVMKSAQSDIVRALRDIKENLNDIRQLRKSITNLQQLLSDERNHGIRSMVLQSLREVLRLQGLGKTDVAAKVLIDIIGNLTGNEQTGQGANPLFSVIEEWKGIIQNEADLQRGLENVMARFQAETLPDNIVQLIKESLEEAAKRLEQGRELKARQIIIEALEQAQRQLPATSQNVSVADSRQEMLQYIANEILQTNALNIKSILITEITERLAKATDEFKVFQREMTHQLSRINIIMEQFRAQSVQQAKPMLEKAIQQLDRTLLKSDWLLFADMKTEKTILKASTQLAEAKKWLAHGDYIKARQIVREVQGTLERLNFKPVNQKVQHILTNEQQWRETRPESYRLSQQFEQVSRTITNNQGSARQVFEGLRGLGLNREAELAQILVNKGQINEAHERDIKSLLLRLSRGEEKGSQLQQQVQQTVQNLSGQQLLGRMDHQQNMQMLLFQLPILLKGQVENLQVFVNSRNENEKLDWENCSLYFLIETKKLGELGIAIDVVDRALTVTLKNDSPSFQLKVEPIAEKYVDRIKDIGFTVNGLKFSKLTKEQSKKVEKREEQLVPTMTKKGFDFKV